MCKLRRVGLLAGLLFIFNGLSAQNLEQELEGSQDYSGVIHPKESIVVSDEMYREILNWLSYDQAESVSLIDFLNESEKLNELEVESFLSEYLSGSKTFSQNDGVYQKTTTSINQFTDCDCKNVIPEQSFDEKSEFNTPYNSKEVDSDWNGQLKRWYKFNAQGLAHDHQHDMSWDDISSEHHRTESNFEFVEILYLCTESGLRSNNCNCDKEFTIEGEYDFEMYQDIKVTNLESRSYNYHRLGFFGFTAERNAEGFRGREFVNEEIIELHTEEMGSEVYKNIFGNYTYQAIQWQQDWLKSPYSLIYSRLTDSIGNPGLQPVDGSQYPDDDYVSLSQLLQSRAFFLEKVKNDPNQIPDPLYAETHSSTQNNSTLTIDKTIPFSLTTRLRSNIPRVIHFNSAIRTGYRVFGTGGNSKQRSKANFWFTYLIPEQNEGWDNSWNDDEPPASIEDGVCCSDEFAAFQYSVLDDPSREAVIKSAILNSLNQDPVNDFGYSLGATVSNGDVVSIDQNQGFVYDLMSCGNCTQFDKSNGQGMPIMWHPIVEVTGSACDGTLQYEVINYNEMPNPGSVTARLVWDEPFGGWQWDEINEVATGTANALKQGSIPSATQTASGAVSARVNYKLEFISSENCTTLVVFNTPLCSYEDDLDCITECIIAPFPNPIVPEDDYLNIDVHESIIDCPIYSDATGFGNYMVEVYSSNGNLVAGPYYSSNAVQTTNSSVSPPAVLRLAIPRSSIPSTGSAVTYYVRITFANYRTYTFPIIVY